MKMEKNLRAGNVPLEYVFKYVFIFHCLSAPSKAVIAIVWEQAVPFLCFLFLELDVVKRF